MVIKTGETSFRLLGLTNRLISTNSISFTFLNCVTKSARCASVDNCHLGPRCLKCGNEHQTRECQIVKVDLLNCINCQTYGHLANYSKCPLFPKPRKGTAIKLNYTDTINSIVMPNISYAQITHSTSQSVVPQQMAPHVTPVPATVKQITQNKNIPIPTPLSDGDRFNSCQVIYSQFGLAIHQYDHQARRRFVEWAQNEIAVVPVFHKRILFSDEAYFWLNGYVNKQNCRIWSEANPQVYVETPLHPEKLSVWCALWAGGIIGPYFFKNNEGHNVTVNGDRYRAMITNFFIPELNNHDVQELWFQQDGATCHTARATIDVLKDTFGDRLISRFGPVNWAQRSCDLTPLDYFLWGYVKSLVYADKPQTLDHLEDNIHRVIADIRPQMLEKVIENWTSRLDYIRASRGSPMPEIIFKM
ncbi:DUF4817 domain-containing protein [Trichonephila clavipes]|nr:DUF4817 domain-containing protein [Trichonephila clavipes]